jgi:hypothetical protein
MATYTHLTCLKEGPEEQLGKMAVAALLDDDELHRVCQNEGSGPVVEFRSTRTSVEVKALKHTQLNKLRVAIDKKAERSPLINFPDF